MGVIRFLRAAGRPGRKIVLHSLCVVLALVLGAVPALAVRLPEAEAEDGNTVIATFITSALEDVNKAYLREWMASERNLLLRRSDGSYDFLIIPDGVTITVSVGSNGLANLTFGGVATSVTGLRMMGWTDDVREFNGHGNVAYAYLTGPRDCILVSGTIFTSDKVTLPMPTGSYVAEFDGKLLLRDDGGLFGAGGEEGGWWQGLLDWLAGFWDALWNFFIRLLVPDKGYFEKWMEELREAANEKLGAVFDMYDALTELFDSLQSDTGQAGSLKLTLPANYLYPGFGGAEADAMPMVLKFTGFLRPVLSSIVLLYTLIICYKRIVVLFEQ